MRFRSAIAAPAAVFFTAVAAALPAHADLKVVTSTTMTGMPMMSAGQSPQIPQTDTTYYKGDKSRLEMGDSVMILDCASNKLYILNPANKTYIVNSFDALMNPNPPSNPMLAKVKLEAKADVTPTAKTSVIAGKPAKEYLYTVSVTMNMENVEGMQRAGKTMTPQFKITGEQWTSDAVALPSRCKRMMQFGQHMPGMLGTAVKSLTEKMSQIKGFPMSSKMTIAMGGIPSSTPEINHEMVITRTVTSISNAPLPSSLFVIPSGYKQVVPPKPQTMPSRPTAIQ